MIENQDITKKALILCSSNNKIVNASKNSSKLKLKSVGKAIIFIQRCQRLVEKNKKISKKLQT
jgi:hypothetical protein